jgi:hypothetical protein
LWTDGTIHLYDKALFFMLAYHLVLWSMFINETRGSFFGALFYQRG